MAGAIIENMSTRKLCVVGGALLALQVAAFLVGGLVGECAARKLFPCGARAAAARGDLLQCRRRLHELISAAIVRRERGRRLRGAPSSLVARRKGGEKVLA